MITIRLDEILRRRGVSIRELSRMTGITYTTIQALYHGQRRSVQLAVLDAICQALGVQPGDVIVYMPSDDLGQAVRAAADTQQQPAPPIPAPSAPRPKRSSDDWSVWG